MWRRGQAPADSSYQVPQSMSLNKGTQAFHARIELPPSMCRPPSLRLSATSLSPSPANTTPPTFVAMTWCPSHDKFIVPSCRSRSLPKAIQMRASQKPCQGARLWVWGSSPN
jgi:hypothetical protein